MNIKKFINKANNIIFAYLPYKIQIQIRLKHDVQRTKIIDRDLFYMANKPLTQQKFVVIRCGYPIYGFFSVINSYIFAAEWLRKKGFIPVLDYEYIYDIQDRKVGDNKLLESIFTTSINVEQLRNEGWVVVDDFAITKNLVQTNKYLNNSKDDNQIRINRTDEWREYYRRAKFLFDKSFSFNKSFITEMENDILNKFVKGKTMGVLLREDFCKKSRSEILNKPLKSIYRYEPCTPDTDEIIDLVKNKLKEWQCEKCFVSTLYSETVSLFNKEFGEKAIFLERERRSFEESRQKITDNSFDGDDMYDQWVKATKYNRDDFMENLYTYMKEIYTLSKCDYFIGVVCSGAVATLMINGGNFKDIVIAKDSNKSIFF